METYRMECTYVEVQYLRDRLPVENEGPAGRKGPHPGLHLQLAGALLEAKDKARAVLTVTEDDLWCMWTTIRSIDIYPKSAPVGADMCVKVAAGLLTLAPTALALEGRYDDAGSESDKSYREVAHARDAGTHEDQTGD